MVNGVVTNSVITNEAIALQDDIDQVAVPRLNAGLRDINAFFSDSFMDGKALLQATKLKQINKFAADVKIKAMDLALQRWSQHLHWNPQVVEQYKSMNQLYWATKVDLNNAIGELNSKVALWNYTIMDHHRAIVATLNGAAAASIKGESKWQSILGGVMGTTSLMGQLGMFGSPAASQAIPGAAAGLSGAAAGTGFGAAMPAIGSVAAQGAGPIGLSGIASMFTSFLAFL
jgi:hypothetical protein